MNIFKSKLLWLAPIAAMLLLVYALWLFIQRLIQNNCQ